MTTPNWIGATSFQPPLAAQVNQFLGTHAVTYVYQGSSFSSQTTAGAGTVASNGLWIAQSFTSGASTSSVGRVAPVLAVTGGPAPLTVQIRANNAGAPATTALVTTVIPPGWGNASPTAQSIPLPVALTPSTTYWFVTQPAGDASNFYAFSKSNQVTGVSTSANGTAWTAQAYGIEYTAYDQTANPPLVHTWEDADARITEVFSNANGTPAALEEYTVAQGSAQFVYSYRAYAYTSGFLTTIS
jgi:hypothetical protein